MSLIIDWPTDLIPNEMTIVPESNGKGFPSPFSGSTQTVGYPGTKWKADLTFNNLDEQPRRKLETIIAKLDGMAGRVRIWDFAARLVSNPQPVYGNPIVTQAESLGSMIPSRGWDANKRVLNYGDWIQIGDELKRVTADIDSDMSGQAIIHIAPMLRNTYSNGTPLIVARPCGIFMLADGKQGKSKRVPLFGTISLSLTEAFYP